MRFSRSMSASEAPGAGSALGALGALGTSPPAGGGSSTAAPPPESGGSLPTSADGGSGKPSSKSSGVPVGGALPSVLFIRFLSDASRSSSATTPWVRVRVRVKCEGG